MSKEQKKDYVEIDLLSLFQTIWDKRIMIVALTALVTLVVLLFNLFVLDSKYSSTTKIYVVNQNENEKITAQDLQLGNYLVQDYKEIILSRDVLDGVIGELKLPYTAKKMLDNITVSIPKGTRIINITVQDKDAGTAKMIADTLRKLSSNKIKNVTRVYDVTVLEEAQISSAPSYPNVKRNTLLGFVIALFVMCLSVVLIEVIRDRVNDPEDIESKLGLPLLGVIPLGNAKRK